VLRPSKATELRNPSTRSASLRVNVNGDRSPRPPPYRRPAISTLCKECAEALLQPNAGPLPIMPLVPKCYQCSLLPRGNCVPNSSPKLKIRRKGGAPRKSGNGPAGFTPNSFLVPFVGGLSGKERETLGGCAGGSALLIASNTFITVRL
jgi:hypothetical protein